MAENKVYRSIDLFAGIGGIRMGFDRAFGDEIETVFASEWDPYAQQTYKANFDTPEEINGDITKIDEKDVPDFDICLAGFPCQAFSIAGRKQGFNDDYKGMSRGTLFFDVVRICDFHRPKVIFCENVKGLTIQGLHSCHDAVGGSERGPNTMYYFEMDGVSVCHCGDMGCIPDDDVIAKIQDVDMLFVPVGETFTLPLSEVRRFIELVNPNIIVPMHYRVGGLSIPISPLDDFLEMIPEEAVDYIGNEIDVTREDIDGMMKECWVFDR